MTPIHHLVTDADRKTARDLMHSSRFSSEPAFWVGYLSSLFADAVGCNLFSEDDARIRYAVFEQLLLNNQVGSPSGVPAWRQW